MRALDGIRVVEVSQFEVGTVCGQQLAWLGADVIKVEKPGEGDGTRVWPAFFATLNSSKRSVTIDLKAAPGRQAFLDLVRTADVVVENLAPGKFEALGLAYEVLREVNARVVFARAKGFGTWGPYASYKAFDMIAQATSGAMVATGEADGPPLIERFPVADNATGIHLALAIMAALWQRQTTGEGQQVEASLHDTMLSMGRAWFALQRFGGEVHGTTSHHQRNGNRAKTAGDLYPCKGGDRFDQVYILCMETRPMWRALLELVGRPDLAAVDPDPFNASDQYSRAVDESISAWTSQHDKFEAMRLLGEAGIPAGAVLTPDEVIADPHNAAREMIVEVEHPSYGKCHILGSPLKLSASEMRIDAPAFELGEHTDEVLGDLGYSAEQVRATRNDKS
jgi:formyl-CoA transferase